MIGAIPLRVLTVSFAAAAFFAALYLARRFLFALLGAGLVALLLYNEISGQLLTLALGLEGLVLLATGFPLHERSLRLSGLALLLGCTGKLLLYDLRNLETPYRIVSFLAVGLIMVVVSWVYSRRRPQIEKYL